jgi:C1A family cysteine protease
MSQKRRYGWTPDLPDARDKKYEKSAKSVSLPALIDMRLLDSPIQDQGQEGSCTANAWTGHMQFLENKDKIPQRYGASVVYLSRQFLYYNERVIEETVNQDSGAQLRDGAQSLSTQGICREVLWSYSPSHLFATPPLNCYQDALNRLITNYLSISTLDGMKNCLASGYPFVFGFTVYDSFESDQVAATGVVPMPGPNESVLGGHAVMALGYDDSSQRFLCRNSWGKNWGMAGYFTIPYEYLTNADLASDMWTIRTGKLI